MMNRCFLIASLLLGSCCGAQNLAAQPVALQSADSYEAALRNNSTSPSYVQIFIANGDTAPLQPVCIGANYLLGALRLEYGSGTQPADFARYLEIALQSPGRAFRFHQQAALDNLVVRYSDQDLAAARAVLAPYSPAQLKEKFSSLLDAHLQPTNGHPRDAVACALIERGLSPRSADISGHIYLGK